MTSNMIDFRSVEEYAHYKRRQPPATPRAIVRAVAVNTLIWVSLAAGAVAIYEWNLWVRVFDGVK